MTAAGTELVGSAHGAKAVPATRRKLVVALRAKMEITLYVGGAGRAPRNLRLTQQEVKHGANAPRHHKADQHPEARTHAAARRIPAHVPNHQEVERGHHTPREIQVNAQAERRNM